MGVKEWKGNNSDGAPIENGGQGMEGQCQFLSGMPPIPAETDIPPLLSIEKMLNNHKRLKKRVYRPTPIENE